MELAKIPHPSCWIQDLRHATTPPRTHHEAVAGHDGALNRSTHQCLDDVAALLHAAPSRGLRTLTWPWLQRQTPPRPNGAHGTPEERRGTEQECGQHPWWVLFCDGGTAGTASQGTAARAAFGLMAIQLRACVSAVFLSTKHIASGQGAPG